VSYQMSISPNVRKSPYFDATVADGVKSFAIYNHTYMPVDFGDPDAEYDRLLNGVVMWDVACERQVELDGPDAGKLAQYLSARDLSGAVPGQGMYVPLCDYEGNLINDPILLKLSASRFWLSIADSDISLWAKAIAAERKLEVKVREPDVSPLAVQGPKAEDVIAELFGDWVRNLKYFWFRETDLDGIRLLVMRSGWSKQGGFELFLLDGSRGADLWNRVKTAGKSHAIGPGAPNDIERIESGLLSWGTDVDIHTNPYEVGLGKYVDLEKVDEFVGQAALKKIMREGIKRRQVGLFLSGRNMIPNPHPYPVLLDNNLVGTMSAAVYSPRLGKNIALALIDAKISNKVSGLQVDCGDHTRAATVTDLPFC